jgi:signal peptidase I
VTDRRQVERRQLPVWQETVLLVAVAMVLAVVVKTFFIQAFYIPSESMEPTMMVDDKILVQKLSYWTGEPHRGDIVVFDDPGGWLPPDENLPNPIHRFLSAIGLAPTGGHLIKRVVGIGGDTVKCCDAGGHLLVNGKPITEPYVLDESVIKDRVFEVTLKHGYIWVMGDNRGNSGDSVAHLGDPGGGQVREADVVGKAWFRVWPLSRFGMVDGTDAFGGVGQ